MLFRPLPSPPPSLPPPSSLTKSGSGCKYSTGPLPERRCTSPRRSSAIPYLILFYSIFYFHVLLLYISLHNSRLLGDMRARAASRLCVRNRTRSERHRSGEKRSSRPRLRPGSSSPCMSTYIEPTNAPVALYRTSATRVSLRSRNSHSPPPHRCACWLHSPTPFRRQHIELQHTTAPQNRHSAVLDEEDSHLEHFTLDASQKYLCSRYTAGSTEASKRNGTGKTTGARSAKSSDARSSSLDARNGLVLSESTSACSTSAHSA